MPYCENQLEPLLKINREIESLKCSHERRSNAFEKRYNANDWRKIAFERRYSANKISNNANNNENDKA